MSFKNHVFFVSRQCYWGMEPDEQNVVEVAQGGLDYSNADMLCSVYDGEGEEYTGMVAAVEAAIKIAAWWRKDDPQLTIQVATGNTGGMTIPFEGEPDTGKILEEAKEFDAKLPHCPQCAEIAKLEWHHELSEEEKFCSENCCNLSLEWYQMEDAVCRVSEAMSESHVSDSDLMEITRYHANVKKTDAYDEQPENERSDWLIRDVLSWHDLDELLQEIEDTGK